MTNTELTLDQLQAISGGFGWPDEQIGLLPKDQVVAIECKIPATFKKPQDKINNTGDDR